MNKGDLVNAVAEAAGITKTQAGSAIDAVFSGIEASLKSGSFSLLVCGLNVLNFLFPNEDKTFPI